MAGNWPGIGAGELYQNGDVHATTDFRSVCKGVLAAHLGVSEPLLDSRVFPGSSMAKPMEDPVAAVRSVA